MLGDWWGIFNMEHCNGSNWSCFWQIQDQLNHICWLEPDHAGQVVKSASLVLCGSPYFYVCVCPTVMNTCEPMCMWHPAGSLRNMVFLFPPGCSHASSKVVQIDLEPFEEILKTLSVWFGENLFVQFVLTQAEQVHLWQEPPATWRAELMWPT